MNNELPIITHLPSSFTPLWTQSTQIYRCEQHPYIDSAFKHNVHVGYTIGLKTGLGLCGIGFVLGLLVVELFHAKK